METHDLPIIPTVGSKAYEALSQSYMGLPLEISESFLLALKMPQVRKIRPLCIYSDDGEQCLTLLHSCFTKSALEPEFDPEVFAEYIVEACRNDMWRGCGGGFITAASQLTQGTSCFDSASISAGIGCMMRIGPLGALYRHRSDDMLAVATFQSAMVTHKSYHCAILYVFEVQSATNTQMLRHYLDCQAILPRTIGLTSP